MMRLLFIAISSRYARACALCLAFAGCYLPSEFRGELHISRSGDYRFVYEGDLVHGGLLRQLANAELDEDEQAETIDAIERDLARDPAFTAVEYRGNATFTVRYERRGNFYRHCYFTFVRHNSRVVSLGYVEEEETITVKGGAIPSSYHEQLTALGYQVNGELRITADLDVKDHNATEVIRDDQGTTYLWIFRSIADPPARLVMG